MKRFFYLTAILLFVFSQSAFNQWTQCNGPYGGDIKCITELNQNIFVGTTGGVYKTTDKGQSWLKTSNNMSEVTITSLVKIGLMLYAGTSGNGLYVSGNEGVDWIIINKVIDTTYIYDISQNNGDLFIATDCGIFKSTDAGNNWQILTERFNNNQVTSIVFVNGGSRIFASTCGSGIYTSSDNGDSWMKTNTGIDDLNISKLIVKGNTLFAATEDGDGGIYKSTDNGSNWKDVITGLTDLSVNSLFTDGTDIIAGTLGGKTFITTDDGAQWSDKSNGLPGNTVKALYAASGYYYAGCYKGVFISSDKGTSWLEKNSGISAIASYCFLADGTNIFAGTDDGIRKSTDNGLTWIASSTGIPLYAIVKTIITSGQNLFAGTSNDAVYYSTDNGTNWLSRRNGIPDNTWIKAMAIIGNNIFAASEGQGIFLSSDEGANWKQINNGLTDSVFYALAVNGNKLFAGSLDRGVFVSSDLGTSWKSINNGLTDTSINTLKVSNSSIYAGTANGVFVSTDDGGNWSKLGGGSLDYSIKSLALTGTNIFACAWGVGVNLSTDNGTTWKLINTGINNIYPVSVFIYNANLFAGTLNGVFSAKVSDFIQSTTLIPPNLITPLDQSKNITIGSYAKWETVANADSYELEISELSDFSTLTVDSNLTATECQLKLSYDKTYYWKVKAINSTNQSSWSSVWSFTIASNVMTLDLGGNKNISPGQKVQIGKINPVIGGTPPYTYLWSPDKQLSSVSIPNPIASPLTTTVYTLTVTDSKNMTAKDSIIVTVDNNTATANLVIDSLLINPKYTSKYVEKIAIRFADGNLMNFPNKPDKIKATIRVDKNLFFPSLQSGVISQWSGDWVIMTREVDFNKGKVGDTVISFEGTFLLGDTVYSPIIIDTVIWTGLDVYTNLQNGSVNLIGIHEINGLKRLLKFNWGAKLLNIAPNPANDKIALEIESQEPAEIDVVLYSNLGIEVLSEKFRLEKTKEIVNLRIPEIMTNGTYHIALTLNGQKTDSKILIIIK